MNKKQIDSLLNNRANNGFFDVNLKIEEIEDFKEVYKSLKEQGYFMGILKTNPEYLYVSWGQTNKKEWSANLDEYLKGIFTEEEIEIVNEKIIEDIKDNTFKVLIKGFLESERDYRTHQHYIIDLNDAFYRRLDSRIENYGYESNSDYVNNKNKDYFRKDILKLREDHKFALDIILSIGVMN